MKLSKTDLAILDNFQSINDSVIIQQGQKQKTMSPGKGIIALATLEADFPNKIPTYRLGQFLDVVRTFSEPDLEFTDKSVIIKDTETASEVEYFNSQENLIKATPDVNTPKENVVTFELSKETLLKIKKMANVLGSEHIRIYSKNNEQFIGTFSESGDMKFKFGSNATQDFSIVFAMTNLIVMNDAYDVEVFSSPILLMKMTARNIPITYLVVADKERSKV